MSELQSALKDLNKKFGKGFIDYGGKTTYNEYDRHSFGIFELDLKTGGGLPYSKVISLAGKYSSGKTTTAICLAAQVQKKGGKVVWVDTENSLDPIWAKKFGLDYKDLLICQPETIEEVTDVMDTLLVTKELDLIVFDSVASTATKRELEESGEQKYMGGSAKEVGQLMRKVTARLLNSQTSIVIINQLRDKVGGWGSAEYMSGGHQLKNQSHIIIYMRASKWIGDMNEPKGIEIKFRVNKNKTATPLKVGVFDIMFDGFINNKKSLAIEAVKQGIIEKSGSWYSYKDLEKVQGLESLLKKIGTKELKNIRKKIIKNLNEK